MGSLFLVSGSVAGASLAWLFGRHERRRSTIASFTGVLCALFGIVASIGHGAVTPVTHAAIGFLGAATPLTWCATVQPASGGVASAARRFSSTLALSLVCGMACAALGFAAGYAVRYAGHKEFVGEPAHSSITGLP